MKNQPSELKDNNAACLHNAAALIPGILPEVALLVDTSLSVIALNQPAKEAVWQIKRTTLTHGMPSLSLVSTQDQPRITALAADVPAGSVTLKHLHPPDPNKIYETGFLPARNKAGDVAGILLRLVNITEREKAGQAVQEAEERRRFAFEATDPGTSVYSGNGVGFLFAPVKKAPG